VIPPPPNATVVVCVLAGTGRADLWVRNNRGQTPVDLCPADQPLRRALIKCCDAAAQARNVQTNTTATAVGETDGSSAPTLSDERPQLSQLMLPNMPPDYSIKAPYHDAYAPLMSKIPDAPKECTKTFATRNDSDFLKISSTISTRFMNAGIPPPQPSMMLLGDRTSSVLLDDPSTTTLSTVFSGLFSGRVDNNLMRGTDNDVDNNDPEPELMDNNSISSVTSNANGSIVIDNSNNR